MTERARMYCEFVAGLPEYIDVAPRPVSIEALPDGRTLARARVCHANGERIKWGTAYSKPAGLELYYQTACAGAIEFEQYAVELEFHLTALPFEPLLQGHLVHDPNGHVPRDITGINDFDEYAFAFGWVYDNGWLFEDEGWSCYGGPARFSGYILLRQPPARTVVIAIGGGQHSAVWRGEVTTTLEFDDMLQTLNKQLA